MHEVSKYITKLFILVTCCSQFDLYLSFSSAGYMFSCSEISSFVLWSECVCPAANLKNFISIDVHFFYPCV